MLENLWCPDADAAAKACWEYCRLDAERSISIADEVCENRFTFRDHWEMERTNIPVQFGPQERDIDWKHIPAGDPEWLYAMNRHTSFVNLGKAWRYTGDVRYAEKYARLISDWIDREPFNSTTSENTWRSLEAGLRCEYWLRAMKLFENSPVLTKSLKEKIDRCLAVHGSYLEEKYGLFHELSNWGVLQDHGLFLLGVYFDRQDWRDLALRRLDVNLHRSVMRDGSQWEQSPMYHCEVLHCAMDTLLIARQNGIIVSSRFEESVHHMCTALAAWMTPDGRLLCQSDSDDTNALDLVAAGAVIFSDGMLRTVAGDKFFEENYWDFGPEQETFFTAMIPETQHCASTALPDSGNYLLRTSLDRNAAYVHFHCGCMGSGHGHADLLHVDAGIGGEDVLIDSGRYTYVDCPIRAQLKLPAAHNTTRVDEKDFTCYVDSWSYSDIAIPIKGESCFTEVADSVSAMHLGYLERGVVTGRKVVFLKAMDTVLICDQFYAKAQEAHTYEAHFHFGPGQCRIEDGSIRWQGKQASAVLMNLDGATCTLGKAPYSRDYNALLEGDVLTVKKKKTIGFASMLHVLTMNCDGDCSFQAKRIPVTKIISGEILTDAQAEAVQIQKDGKSAVVILCHGEVISAVDMLSAGGYHGYGKLLVFTQQIPEGICMAW